jgi:hypothetical protein
MTTPFDAFGILDMRVGRIARCEPNVKARLPACVLGLPNEDGHVVLIAPDRDVPLGGRVFLRMECR